MNNGSRLPWSGLRPWVGAALAVYWIGLFIGTHVPLPQGALPGSSDKLAHLAAYAGLAVLLAVWLPKPTGTIPVLRDRQEDARPVSYGDAESGETSRGRRLLQLTPRRAGLVLMVVAVYGAADELLQIPVGRHADLYDWLADCAGALIGLGLLWTVQSVLTMRGAST